MCLPSSVFYHSLLQLWILTTLTVLFAFISLFFFPFFPPQHFAALAGWNEMLFLWGVFRGRKENDSANTQVLISLKVDMHQLAFLAVFDSQRYDKYFYFPSLRILIDMG